jgi:GxxExxY protein
MSENTVRSGLALLHGDITRAIIGSFFEVYNELGYGFAEGVYQRALPIVLSEHGLHIELERRVTAQFRGATIGEYRPDLIVEDKVIVECKVAAKILPAHESQLLNYLKATGINIGLIFNFGSQPTFRRMLLTSGCHSGAAIRA